MKNKTMVFSIVFPLFILIMLVSCRKEKAEWKGKIEKENGIIVVKNPKEPMYSKVEFSLEKELKIGEAEGREEYMFSQICSIVVDEEENIYSADFKEINIKVFDRNGAFLRNIGKAGQGPGEIGRPYMLQVTRKSELLVTDGRNRKIHYYSLEGEHLRSKSLKKVFPLNLYCDTKENYYVLNPVRDPPDDRFELVRLDSEMNPVATLKKIPTPDSSEPLRPFTGFFDYQVMNDDNILFGHSDNYELEIINPWGNILKKITKKYNPLPISEDIKKEVREHLPPEREVKFPRYYCAFAEFFLDDEGRIFVRTWEKPNSGAGFVYDFFDSEGRYIAKIPIPLNFNPQGCLPVWKSSNLYIVEEDEGGYQYINRYKVNWKY